MSRINLNKLFISGFLKMAINQTVPKEKIDITVVGIDDISNIQNKYKITREDYVHKIFDGNEPTTYSMFRVDGLNWNSASYYGEEEGMFYPCDINSIEKTLHYTILKMGRHSKQKQKEIVVIIDNDEYIVLCITQDYNLDTIDLKRGMNYEKNRNTCK